MLRWRWILPVLVLVVIGIGVAGAIWGDGDWGPRHHDSVTRVVGQDGTQTIVIDEGHGGFFPFFLIFPLGFLALILFRGFAFPGRFGRGPWAGGGPGAGSSPAWFDEWHRRAHSQTAPPDGGQPAATD